MIGFSQFEVRADPDKPAMKLFAPDWELEGRVSARSCCLHGVSGRSLYRDTVCGGDPELRGLLRAAGNGASAAL